MKPWWERIEGLLDYEVRELERDGARVQVDQEAFENRHVVELNVGYPIGGETVQLSTVFPDTYPYFRPEVYRFDGTWDRHYNPLMGNLCLLERGTHSWHSDWTLARLLREQLPKWIEAVETDDPKRRAELEVPQGEPASAYYPTFPESMVFVDGGWDLPAGIDTGTIRVGITFRDDPNLPAPSVRGVVSEVHDPRGRNLATFSGRVPSAFDEKTITGRWHRLPAPILRRSYNEIMNELERVDQAHRRRGGHAGGGRLVIRSGRFGLIEVIGYVYPEEIRQSEYADAWLFVVRVQRLKKGEAPTSYFVATGRAAPHDLAQRIPGAAPLYRKRVLVVGLGAVGGPIALELARLGAAELRLVDHDVVEPAPTVRWPLGLEVCGQAKVDALASFIQAHYPNSKVVVENRRLGQVPVPGDQPTGECEALTRLIDGADLVIDTSAEVGVAHLLSDLATEARLPFIHAHATPGVAGGLVGRFLPGGDDACWMCMRHAIYVTGTTPEPRADETAVVQPAGCADLTFTGLGVDLQEVALETIRSAIDVMAAVEQGANRLDWGVAILSLHDEKGRRIPPRWETRPVPRNPECDCGKRC